MVSKSLHHFHSSSAHINCYLKSLCHLIVQFYNIVEYGALAYVVDDHLLKLNIESLSFYIQVLAHRLLKDRSDNSSNSFKNLHGDRSFDVILNSYYIVSISLILGRFFLEWSQNVIELLSGIFNAEFVFVKLHHTFLLIYHFEVKAVTLFVKRLKILFDNIDEIQCLRHF